MCGVKPCRKCDAKKARMNGVKRKRMAKRTYRSKKDIGSQLMNIGVAAVGYIVADQVNKLPFVNSNPVIGNAIKLGVGAYLASTGKSPMIVSAAGGMALNGALGFGRQYGIVSGVGLITSGSLSAGQLSNWNPGVAGSSIIVR